MSNCSHVCEQGLKIERFADFVRPLYFVTNIHILLLKLFLIRMWKPIFLVYGSTLGMGFDF